MYHGKLPRTWKPVSGGVILQKARHDNKRSEGALPVHIVHAGNTAGLRSQGKYPAGTNFQGT